MQDRSSEVEQERSTTLRREPHRKIEAQGSRIA